MEVLVGKWNTARTEIFCCMRGLQDRGYRPVPGIGPVCKALLPALNPRNWQDSGFASSIATRTPSLGAVLENFVLRPPLRLLVQDFCAGSGSDPDFARGCCPGHS